MGPGGPLAHLDAPDPDNLDLPLRRWQSASVLLGGAPALALGGVGVRWLAGGGTSDPEAGPWIYLVVCCVLLTASATSLITSHLVAHPHRWRLIAWWLLAAVPLAVGLGPLVLEGKLP